MCYSEVIRELEGKRFLVDLFPGYAQPLRCVDHSGPEAVRTADVYVAYGQVRNQPPQHMGVEADPAPGADDLMEPTATLLDQRSDLVPVDEIIDR